LLIFGSFAAAEGRAAGACGLNRFQLTSQSSAVKVKFYRGGDIPLGLHKVRVVQKLHLVPVERRMEAIRRPSSTPSASTRPTCFWTCSPTAASMPWATTRWRPCCAPTAPMPRRIFTRSHIDYVIDRLTWLCDNRAM